MIINKIITLTFSNESSVKFSLPDITFKVKRIRVHSLYANIDLVGSIPYITSDVFNGNGDDPVGIVFSELGTAPSYIDIIYEYDNGRMLNGKYTIYAKSDTDNNLVSLNGTIGFIMEFLI